MKKFAAVMLVSLFSLAASAHGDHAIEHRYGPELATPQIKEFRDHLRALPGMDKLASFRQLAELELKSFGSPTRSIDCYISRVELGDAKDRRVFIHMRICEPNQVTFVNKDSAEPLNAMAVYKILFN